DTSAFKQRVITLPSGERVHRVVRPKFRATLGFLAQGGVGAVVAYDLDRAVRDPRCGGSDRLESAEPVPGPLVDRLAEIG
ncbi:MAG: hypothetical protein LBJ08_01130, partial [Bifidobacteriaceae bacterium]|nr:hypothetical protein [Bifidobacteriaceae bacterium]